MATKGTLLSDVCLRVELDDAIGTGRHTELTPGAFFFVNENNPIWTSVDSTSNRTCLQARRALTVHASERLPREA